MAKMSLVSMLRSASMPTASDDTENLEVTEEQHLLQLNVVTSDGVERQPSPVQGKRFSKLMRRSQSLRRPREGCSSRNGDAASVSSSQACDAATVSGLRSVSTFHTFSSHDTVKMSNRQPPAPPVAKAASADATPKRGRWKTLKKALSAKSSAVVESLTRRSKDEDEDNLPPTPLQGRARSAGSTDTAALTVHSEAPQPLDESIRGRLDGVDVLALGSAYGCGRKATLDAATKSTPWNAWTESCIGNSPKYTPEQMVADMLRTSGGQAPQVILEGFDESDRWGLRIEEGFEARDSVAFAAKRNSALPPTPPVLTSSSSSEDDGGSPDMPTHKLWSTLWGQDPMPASTMPTLDEIGSGDEEGDPLLDLAAESSVPIDVDEDTFIVSTREHLDAIQGIASVPIAGGRFVVAIRILEKLVLGLDSSVSERIVKDNLRGVACHNIGLLYMWHKEYQQALESFSKAEEARQQCSFVTPRDVGVTQVRKGQALFALGRCDEALSCFHAALATTEEDQVVRAKILNNIGVAYYHLGDLSTAVKSFTEALTIQRKRLDGPVRREALVYDAAVSLSNMGKIYLETGDNHRASVVYEEALRLQTSVFRKDHEIVLTSLQNYAFSQVRLSHGLKAIKTLERCRRAQVALHGVHSACVIETCGWMAHICARENKVVKAQALYEAVYAWQKAYMSSRHPAVRRIRACLSMLPPAGMADDTSPLSQSANLLSGSSGEWV
jgi:tetratricopeptide (TPR) repeat protein